MISKQGESLRNPSIQDHSGRPFQPPDRAVQMVMKLNLVTSAQFEIMTPEKYILKIEESAINP